MLIVSNGVHADRAQVVHRRAQGNGFRDRGGARLKLVGQSRIGRVIQKHISNHFPSTEEGRHGVEHV